MGIEVVSRQRIARVDAAKVKELAAAVLTAGKHRKHSITLAFLRDPAMRRLNRDYRGKDYATDVLSFPGGGDPGNGLEGGNFLGDVVISADAAARQAAEAGHSLEREISELVIHGVLHLCGYDHETDEGEMDRLELRLRREILGSD